MVASRTIRRRWFQIGLGTLLALTTLVAVGLLGWRVYVEPYRRQRQAMGVIEKLGGSFHTVAATSWQRRLFGQDFQNLTLVNLAHCNDPAAYIAHVADLPALETLIVGGPAFGDEYLRRLHRLRTLRILVLDSTGATDEALTVLQRQLPAVFVYLAERRSIHWLGRLHVVKDYASTPPPQLQPLVGTELSLLVQSVDNSGAGFSDADMAHITRLRHLTALGLSYTQLTDDGLAGLASLKNFQDLDLSCTLVSDLGLQHLVVCQQLQRLNLRRTQVGDVGLAHLTSFTQLELLDLSQTRVTDAGLAQLPRLRLKRLGLDGTSVGDAGLAELAALTQLEDLHLSQTRITDAGLVHLRRLKQLRYLDLFGTRVTAAGVEELGTALPNCHITAYCGRTDASRVR